MTTPTPQQNTDWKDKISKILVHWDMPTRQSAINEIVLLINAAYQRGMADKVVEVREAIQELGHQQENDEIWCDMDEVLSLKSLQ